MYLDQVADIVDGEKEAESLSRINGKPGLTLQVLKVQDANMVEVGRDAKAAVEKLKKIAAARREPAGRLRRRRTSSRSR